MLVIKPQYMLHFTPHGHWTCSFVCHFNSTESMQSCSHFGALNLSYTLPSLSYQVLIFTWVKWSTWGWSTLPKDTTSKQCPKIERGETWHCRFIVWNKAWRLVTFYRPWSLDLFIRVPFQLHGEHAVLQPFRRIELIVRIAISVLPGTDFHLSQVKHLMMRCHAQGHNIETMSQDWEGRNMTFLWKSWTKRNSKSHDRQRHRQSCATF